MAISSTSGGGPDASPLSCCGECGERLAHDQRYCVECGARRGPLRPAIAELIGVGPRPGLGPAQPGVEESTASEGAADGDAQLDWRSRVTMPSPAVAAAAVMAVLAFGVLVGSAASPIRDSSAVAPIIVAVVTRDDRFEHAARGAGLGAACAGAAGSDARSGGLEQCGGRRQPQSSRARPRTQSPAAGRPPARCRRSSTSS